MDEEVIPKGYKNSEVGVIPEEWDVSSVGNEFDIKLGKMLDSEKNTGISKPYIGNKAVQWNRFDLSELSTVPLSRYDLERFRLCKGDLLVCEGGEVGRAAIWNNPIDECYFQKALHRLRPMKKFNSELMLAYLSYWVSIGYLDDYVTQTSIAHLPREKFLLIPLPRPHANEQRAIATALSDIDALIAGLDQLIAKKRALKQAAMQQLLTGQIRLPEFEGKWRKKKISEVCTMKSGAGITAENIDEYSKYPCYGGNGRRGFTSSYTHQGKFALIGRQGALCGNVLYVEGQFYASEHAVVVTAGGDSDIAWLTFLLRRMNLNRLSESSAQPGLSVGKILDLESSFPIREEQTAIASILSDMDTELAALEQRRDKTRLLKQGMMQELLTGRIRLVDKETPASANGSQASYPVTRPPKVAQASSTR